MTVLNLAVGASSDDAAQNDGSPDMTGPGVTPTTSSIGTGTTSNVPKRMVGVRFTAVTIVQASTITTAVLKACSNGDFTTISHHWFGFANDNAATFTAAEDMSARTRTTASVFCNAENISRTAGTFYGYPNTSGDVAAVVQEIVNRAGWASGNALGMVAYGDGATNFHSGTLRMWDFAANPGATLVITYTAAGGAAAPPSFRAMRGMG